MSPALGALSALLLLVSSGCLWVSADGRQRAPLHLLALGHLSGSAALAAGMVWSLAAFDRIASSVPLVAVLLLGIGGVARRRWRPYGDAEVGRCGSPTTPARAHSPTRSPQNGDAGEATATPWLDLTLLILALAGFVIAASRVWLLPLDWDGWAIWQLKARGMVANELRAQLTDPRYAYSHVEYPLLVPSHTWWLCRGEFSARIAQAGGLLFLCDLLALFYYEAKARMDRTWALAGCVAIVSWALVPKHTASGFADIPMAAFAFGAITLLTANNPPTFMPLLLGATLTKNEGLFTLAACLAVVALGLNAGEGSPRSASFPWRARGRCLAVVVGAVLAGLAPWSAVKQRWSLPTEFLDPKSWPDLSPGEIGFRLGVVAQGFARQFGSFGPWYPGWGLTWLLAIAGLSLAVRRRLRATAPLWILVAAHFAGATAAYLMTKTHPALHLDRSLDRLMLHVAPAALLATLMAFHSLNRETEPETESWSEESGRSLGG